MTAVTLTLLEGVARKERGHVKTLSASRSHYTVGFLHAAQHDMLNRK